MTRSSMAMHYSLEKTVKTTNGEAAVYIFVSERDALVASADNQAVPLLGILDSRQQGDPNPQFNYWLEKYADQIEWMRNNSITTRSDDNNEEKEWKEIAPLLTTKWNQGEPYNQSAPMQDGKRCYTGCVATAVAQVMNYHKWPERGEGTQTYKAEKIDKELKVDFSNYTFDWENMLDTYSSTSTSASKRAVADLMYAVGVGVEMNFGPSESGAYSELVPRALVDFFKYDKSAHISYRNYMTQEKWNEFIYNQLSNVGPLYYSGSSDSGAHAFVCDGYKDGMYHINWGWGGSNDGYYRLSALYPGAEQGAGGSGGAYNFDQSVIADVKRPSATSEMVPVVVAPWGLTLPRAVSKVSNVNFSGWIMNYSSCALSIDLGVVLEDEDGNRVEVEAGSSSSFTAKIMGGKSGFTVTLPKDLAEGEWTVRPIYRVSGSGKWNILPIGNGHPRYFTMTTSGSYYLFEPEPLVSVRFDDFSLAGPALQGKMLRFSGLAVNSYKQDYEGIVRLVVINPSTGERVANGARVELNLAAGDSEEWNYTTKLYKDFKLITDLPAATYSVFIEDARNNEELSPKISMQYEISKPTTLTVNKFTLANGTKNVDPENVDFVTGVTCDSGYLDDWLTIGIWLTTSPMTHVKDIKTEELVLQPGQTCEVHTLTRLENPVTTHDYIVGLYFEGKQIGSSLYFSVSSSGVEELVSEDIVSTEVYDLGGRRIATFHSSEIDTQTLSRGVYVMVMKLRNGKTFSRQTVVK